MFRMELPHLFHPTQAIHRRQEKTVVGPYKKVTTVRLDDKNRPVRSDTRVDNGQVNAHGEICNGSRKHPASRYNVKRRHIVTYVDKGKLYSPSDQDTLAARDSFIAGPKIRKKTDTPICTGWFMHYDTSSPSRTISITIALGGMSSMGRHTVCSIAKLPFAVSRFEIFRGGFALDGS
jgi:hypothetical protein